MTQPQDRKTPEREVYQEVNCNGKEINKKEVNYGNVVCGQGTTGSKEMNKKEVNDGNGMWFVAKEPQVVKGLIMVIV